MTGLKLGDQMNASLKQLDKPLSFSCECIFKREIRNEPVSMPLVNGPIFIQTFFFSFPPLHLCELVKLYGFKAS